MASLKDVAKKANVSIATVSKVIHDHNDISDKTKKIVKDAIIAVDYSPNLSARRLKMGYGKRIGVIYMVESAIGQTHEFFVNILISFKETIEKAGYEVVFFNHKYQEKVNFYEYSKASNLDGVCIINSNHYEGRVLPLIESSLPVVTIDRKYDNKIAIMSDNRAGYKALIDYVVSLGHEKIAFIHGQEGAVTKRRIQTYNETLLEYNIEPKKDYLLEIQYNNSVQCYDAVKKLLDLKDPPTCILCSDDNAAIGAYNLVKDLNLKIPEDISIVGYDGISLSQFISPKITTYHQNSIDMGTLAGKKLIQLVKKENVEIESIYIEGELLVGESVSKINNKNSNSI